MTYDPTPSQRAVIEATNPVVVVLGGAGCGKTVTAADATRAHLVAKDDERVALRRQVWASGRRSPSSPLPRALFLSFSRTAVTQIHDRSAELLAGYRDRVDVMTFHALAWRLVQHWGQYDGLPPDVPFVGDAEAKLLGSDGRLTYGDLLPRASRVLAIYQVSQQIANRYTLVICDEFQDTGPEEWHLVRRVARRSRLLLLADANQCIYAGMKGIDPVSRIAEAQALPGAVTITLVEGSRRDPSQLLPAAAEAVLSRDFRSSRIGDAVAAGRLEVVRTGPAGGADAVAEAVLNARSRDQTVGVFTHGNAQTAELCEELTGRGVRHQPVGFAEAFAESLSAQLAMVAFAMGAATFAEVRQRVAVFVSSSIRSRTPPPLAHQIRTGRGTSNLLARKLDELERRLRIAAEPSAAVEVAASAFAHLLLSSGADHWAQASRRLQGLVAGLPMHDALAALSARVEAVRIASLTEAVSQPAAAVQVMNLHQTKGREADATIVLVQEGDWFGPEHEPFPEGSRLLYVVLTRARHRTLVVVAGAPHQLVAPLIVACERARHLVPASGRGLVPVDDA